MSAKIKQTFNWVCYTSSTFWLIFRQRFFPWLSALVLCMSKYKANILQQWLVHENTNLTMRTTNKQQKKRLRWRRLQRWKRKNCKELIIVVSDDRKPKPNTAQVITFSIWLGSSSRFQCIPSKHILSKINNAMLLFTAACVCECVFNCLFTVCNKCLPLLLHHFPRLHLHSLSLSLSPTHTLTCSDFLLDFICVCFFIPSLQATLCASCMQSCETSWEHKQDAMSALMHASAAAAAATALVVPTRTTTSSSCMCIWSDNWRHFLFHFCHTHAFCLLRVKRYNLL